MQLTAMFSWPSIRVLAYTSRQVIAEPVLTFVHTNHHVCMGIPCLVLANRRFESLPWPGVSEKAAQRIF